MSTPKRNSGKTGYKGYRSMPKEKRGSGFKRPDVNENKTSFTSVWRTGSAASWMEFKQTLFNHIRCMFGWDLESAQVNPATEGEQPVNVPAANVLTDAQTRHAEQRTFLTEELASRQPPGRNATPQEKAVYITWRNDVSARLNREINAHSEMMRRFEIEAKIEDLKVETKNVATAKVFYERFHVGVISLIDLDYIKKSDFRGALAKLDKVFMSEAQEGQVAAAEIDKALGMTYKKYEDFEVFIERFERLHTKLKMSPGVTFAILQKAIMNGDDEELKRALENGRLFIKKSEDLKSIIRDVIVLRANVPKYSATKESANFVSNDKKRKHENNSGSGQQEPCTICGRPFHVAKECWTTKTCRNCNTLGHIESRCPQLKSKKKGPDNKAKGGKGKAVELVKTFDQLQAKK
jgi:hypothetical protein